MTGKKALTVEIQPFEPDRPQPPWQSLFLGDCLAVAPSWPQAQVDLIYLDPPFFTGREHVGKPRPDPKGESAEATRLSFADRWQGGLHEYLMWLEHRVKIARGLLRPTGVMVLHLDWHAVHYAKVMCDGLFIPAGGQFQNELIWYYQTGGASRERFSRKHDSLLVYSMGEKFFFDGPSVAIPRTPGAMKRARCPTGARIKATDTHKNPDDVLVIPALNPMARERNGYPTQKPVALLEFLIQALCPPAGTVCDLFCGSGTTLVAAQKLGRHWIGCDINPAALALARQRLAQVSALFT